MCNTARRTKYLIDCYLFFSYLIVCVIFYLLFRLTLKKHPLTVHYFFCRPFKALVLEDFPALYGSYIHRCMYYGVS